MTTIARRSAVLSVVAVWGFILFAGFVRVSLADNWIVKSVPSGSSSGSAGPEADDECHTYMYPYDWWHGLAYSVNTNTSTRQMTINYLDFYGGDTSPDPPYTVGPPLETVWGEDSWVYSSTDAYQFGDLSAFKGDQFDSYDITLWLWEVISYQPNDMILVESQFGESFYGEPHVDCRSYSYVYLDPPN